MKRVLLIINFFLLKSSSFAQTVIPERIAIMDFQILANEENFNQYKWMSLGFSETLSDAFSRIHQFSVIERMQLSKVLLEQGFQKGNDIDTGSVVKAGKILGVNKILLGSCQIATGYLLINMRIVNVETGQVQPIKKLPIISPIDSVLYLQTRICIEILNQFQSTIDNDDKKEIMLTTTNSTQSMRAYEFLNRGMEFYINEQYEDAIQMYNMAIEYDRKYGKAYYKRGLSNYALQHYDNAAADFSNSSNYLKRDTIFVLMSDAYYKKGDSKKSLEYLHKAEKINPNNYAIKEKIKKLSNDNGGDTFFIKHSLQEDELIFEYVDGIAKIKSNKKFGFIDTINNILVPIIYDDIREFRNGLAAVKSGSKWGFVNKKGFVVISPIYSQVGDFNNRGLTDVLIKDKWGVINSKGDIIIPIEFNQYYLSGWDYDSLIIVNKTKGVLGLSEVYGVYDITGKEIIPLIYDAIEIPRAKYNFNNNSYTYYPYILASLNKKWGVIDKTNEIVVPFKYDSKDCIRGFNYGFAAVKINERWGFVNEKGIEIIKPQYENVNEFSALFFLAKSKGKWGLVNFKNEINIPLIYEKLEHIEKNYWAAKKGIFWGVINESNALICDFKFEKMGKDASSNIIIHSNYFDRQNMKVSVILSGKQYWINEKCECIYDCK